MDKGGVFVLIHNLLLDALVKERITSIGHDRRVSEQAHEDIHARIEGWIGRTSKQLRDADLKKHSEECRTVFRESGPSGMLTPINVTIKTPKVRVESRLIDSSCGLPLEGYSALVHRSLMKYAPLAKYLAVDSKSLSQFAGKRKDPSLRYVVQVGHQRLLHVGGPRQLD